MQIGLHLPCSHLDPCTLQVNPSSHCPSETALLRPPITSQLLNPMAPLSLTFYFFTLTPLFQTYRKSGKNSTENSQIASLIHFLTFCHISSFSLSVDHSLSVCRQTHKYTFCHLNYYFWSHHHLVGLNHLRLASMSWIHSSLFVAQVHSLLIVLASLAEQHRLQKFMLQQLQLPGSEAQTQYLWHKCLVAKNLLIDIESLSLPPANPRNLCPLLILSPLVTELQVKLLGKIRFPPLSFLCCHLSAWHVLTHPSRVSLDSMSFQEAFPIFLGQNQVLF